MLKVSRHAVSKAAVFVSVLAALVCVPSARPQTLATMIAPSNGATNVDPGAPFSWNGVSDAQAYYVYVGSAPGLKDVWSSNSQPPTVTSITPKGLQPNTVYYIRLWTEINGAWGHNYVDSSFTTGNGIAHLTYPPNASTNVDPLATFTWNSVLKAQSYDLLIGTTPGGSDVFNSGPITATSTAVPGLQANNSYYARLFTQTASGSSYADSTFATGTGVAHLLVPANGATNVDPGAAMSWSSVSNAQAYYLYIGTSVGAKDVYQSSATLATAVYPTGLSANTLYYARMWTEKNNVWSHLDSTFTTGYGTSHLTYPTPGQTGVDPWAPFTWTSVGNFQSYTLWVGSSQGASDVYNSGPLTTNSQILSVLRQNTIYFARIITQTSLGTTYVDSSFTTGLGKAHLISPANGATQVSPFQPFTWNAVPGAQAYFIYVGTSPNVTDVYNSGQLSSTFTSRIVSGLLGGQTYYVKLWTYMNNTYYTTASSFMTAPQPLPPDPDTFRNTVQQQTGNVRLMTQGLTNTPTPGTPLAQVVAEDGRTVAFCTEYARTLAQQLISLNNISTRVRSMTFDGTSYEAHVTTEYFDPFLNQWIAADPTFGVVYWNRNTTSGLGVSDIEAAVVAQNWSSIQSYILYATSNGEIYSHNYYMDPILLYLNPLPTGRLTVQLPLANSPSPYFSTGTVGTTGNFIFSFVNQTDSATISDPIKGTFTVGPIGGTIYSQSFNLSAAWSVTSQPSGLQVLKMNRYLYF